MLKVLTVTNNIEATMPLINSLQKNEWDTQVLVVEWKGFGTKLITVYEYLKANPEVTEFIFCDAFDVICLGKPAEFKEKIYHNHGQIFCSAEKGLWPPTLHPFRIDYPTHQHGFNYLNSGCYYGPSNIFISLMDDYMPLYETDDQFWMNIIYLMQNHATGERIRVDHSQSIFNSHSFISDGEYGYENGRVQINGNEPLFIHFNGRSVDEKFNELIKL